MLWTTLAVVFIIWLLQLLWQKRKLIALGRKLKSSLSCYPFVGHALLFVGNDEDRMKALQTLGKDSVENGGISKLWFGTDLFINVTEPETAEFLLSNCLEKHELMTVTRFLVGMGSISAPVDIWRPRRKFLAPTFSLKNLNEFCKVFSKQSIILTGLLEKEVGNDKFSFWKYVCSYTMDAVCETTLGVKINAQADEARTLMSAFDELCTLAAYKMSQPWFKNHYLFKFLPCYEQAVKNRDIIWEYIMQIVKMKRKAIEESNNNRTDEEEKDTVPSFLDIQMQSTSKGRKLTDGELMEETIILFIAGVDTSATGIAFTALMLSRHPDVQEKIYEELQEVFGDTDAPVTPKELPRLKYMDAVIRETIRMYPPVPVIVRNIDRDITLPSGLKLAKDCGVLINFLGLNRNPKYFGADVDQFRPERFLNPDPMLSAAFIPFSCGPRGCIGYQYAMMSMKIVLGTFLRRYRVLAPEGVQAGEPLRTKFEIMSRHVHNCEIRVEHRNKASS